MPQITFILVLLTCFAKGQSTREGLVGVYESTGFDRHSTMILDKENRFIYKSGLGGCQTEVKGTWIVENKKLKFTNDTEFTNDGTILDYKKDWN